MSAAPMNAFQTLLGIETLSLRMDRHVENALKVAKHLQNHKDVEYVSYAGLPDSPYARRAQKYTPKGAGALFTIGVKGGYDACVKLVENVEIFSHLANIGDAKSLVLHPASTTHRQLTPEQATAAGAGPVLVREISLASVCVHHLLPFFGKAHVAYLPGERQAGLSKLSRVVDAHARRLQTQERLTASVVRTLEEVLEPRGAIAVIEAEHTCMTLRGVRKEQGRMVTVETSGLYETDPAARAEVLELLTR